MNPSIRLTCRATTQPASIKKKLLTYIAVATIACPAPVLADIIVDPYANVGFQPDVYQNNGVDVIDITTPTAGGVSVNHYDEFSVDNTGAVLNNSTSNGTSALAGSLSANPNLGGQAATTIVNEVTGSTASQLQGQIEVHGQNADVIIANPQGVTCNGCGFINTDRATLTTGTTSLNGNDLDIHVRQGQVEIGADGIESEGNIDLVGRTVKIDGQVQAGDQIGVAAGSLDYHYSQRKNANSNLRDHITQVSQGSNPAVAIDASAYGAMNAGRIEIIATDDGAGVKNHGYLSATADDLFLEAEGDVEIRGTDSVQNTTITTTGDLHQMGDSAAGGAITLSGKDVTTDQAKIIDAGASITINATGNFQHHGVVRANENININAGGNVALGSQIRTPEDFNIFAGGTVELTDTMLYANNLGIVADALILDDALLSTEQALAMSTRHLHVQQGSQIHHIGDLAMDLETVLNEGEIYAGNIEFNVAQWVTNTSDGTIASNNIAIQAGGDITNDGSIQATNNLYLDTLGDITNTGSIASGAWGELRASSLINTNIIESYGHLNVVASDAITNNEAIIRANGPLAMVVVQAVDNAGIIDYVHSGTISNNAGIIESGQFIKMVSENLYNSGAIIGHTDGEFSHTGEWKSEAGIVDVAGYLSIEANDVINNAVIAVNHNFGRQYYFDNFGHDPRDDRNWSYASRTHHGIIRAGNDINLNVHNDFTSLSGHIETDGKISLYAGNDVHTDAIREYRHSWPYDTRYIWDFYDSAVLTGSDIIISSGNDLTAINTKITATNDVALFAEGDMDMGVKHERRYTHYHHEKSSGIFGKKVTIETRDYQIVMPTIITAGGNITLNAIHNDTDGTTLTQSGAVNLTGVQFNSENDVVMSGTDVTVIPANRRYYYYHYSGKSNFGGLISSSDATIYNYNYVYSANLEAERDLSVYSQSDITMTGTNQTAGRDLNLSANGDVLITSANEYRHEERRHSSSNFSGLVGGALFTGELFSSSQELTGQGDHHAIASELQAGENININAGSATIVGSHLQAYDGSIAANTTIGDIHVLAAQEITENYSQQTDVSVTLGDFLSNPNDKVSFDNGQLKLSLGEATYDEIDERSKRLTHQLSSLSAGKNIELTSAGDINLQGANIMAGPNPNALLPNANPLYGSAPVERPKGNVSLRAQGEVNITEVQDTFEEYRKEIHGSGKASFVVRHEAVETVKAVIAVKDARDALEAAKEGYDNYKDELKQMQSTLAEFKRSLANGEPGINASDIAALSGLIDQMKGDKAWHLLNIATATQNLATQTTQMVSQVATAGASATTWGFNAGIHIDLEANKNKSSNFSTTSRASSLQGTNIAILAGNGQDLTVRGSHLFAEDGLTVGAENVNILASADTYSSDSETLSASVGVSQTFWGAHSGPSFSMSLSGSRSSNSGTSYNNSTLHADVLNITTGQDLNINGGNVSAAQQLLANIRGDLNIASVQNITSWSNMSAGISGGFSLGAGEGADSQYGELNDSFGDFGGDAVGGNGGFNFGRGRGYSTETLLSSLTSGGTADINVGNNIDLKGALLATIDDQGNDLNTLNLQAASLSFNDLRNTSFGSNMSAGLNIGGTNIGANYNNSTDHSRSVIMSTVGQGSLAIGTNPLPSNLNRDTTRTNNDIFNVNRSRGIDLSIDTRIYSEQGRKQIAEDLMRSDILMGAIGDVFTNSGVSLFGVGNMSFRENLMFQNQVADGMRNFVNDKKNAKHLATLSNPNATPEQKRAAKQAMVNAIAATTGVVPAPTVKVADIGKTTEGGTALGAYNNATNDIFVFDGSQNTIEGSVNTLGHEAAHAIHLGQFGLQTSQGEEEWANAIGAVTQSSAEFYFGQADQDFGGENNHFNTATSTMVAENRALFESAEPQDLEFDFGQLGKMGDTTHMFSGHGAGLGGGRVSADAVNKSMEGPVKEAIRENSFMLAAFFVPEAILDPEAFMKKVAEEGLTAALWDAAIAYSPVGKAKKVDKVVEKATDKMPGKDGIKYDKNNKDLDTNVDTKKADSSAGPVCCSKCFEGKTLVKTKRGLRPINELKIGDQVWAKDEETGKQAYKKIIDKYVYNDDRVIYEVVISLNGEQEILEATYNHPFYVKDKGWLHTVELTADMELEHESGSSVKIHSITKTVRSPTTYNLEVDGYHTYYAGKTRVWVHNGGAGCTPCAPVNDDGGAPSGSSKNERHGDGGRAIESAEKQIAELKSKMEGLPKKEREKIKRKIRNIEENARKKRKGEEHSRTKKR